MNEQSRMWLRMGAVVALGASFTFGCTSLLGSYEVNDEAAASPTGDGGGTSLTDAAALVDGSSRCAADEKECAGACVKKTDPAQGCGEAACTTCPSGAFVKSLECGAAGECSVACEGTRQNCDGNTANGCEIDTQWDAKNCGVCGKACSAANGGTFCSKGACKTGCDKDLAQCGTSCVNLSNDPDHCGVADAGVGCGAKCPAPANSTPTCNAGVCGVKCNAGFALCGGVCKSTSSPDSCGPTCTVCADKAPNASPICATGACSYRCDKEFDDCTSSVNKVNGCGCKVGTSTSPGPQQCADTRGTCCNLAGTACKVGQLCCAGSQCVAEKCTACEGQPCTTLGKETCCDGYTCSLGKCKAMITPF